MQYFVYILESQKDGGFYVGCTIDLQKRLENHNSGKTSSLRNRRPLEIVYFEEYNNAEEAYKREKQIKSYKGGDAFRNLIKSRTLWDKQGGVA